MHAIYVIMYAAAYDEAHENIAFWLNHKNLFDCDHPFFTKGYGYGSAWRTHATMNDILRKTYTVLMHERVLWRYVQSEWLEYITLLQLEVTGATSCNICCNYNRFCGSFKGDVKARSRMIIQQIMLCKALPVDADSCGQIMTFLNLIIKKPVIFTRVE